MGRLEEIREREASNLRGTIVVLCSFSSSSASKRWVRKCSTTLACCLQQNNSLSSYQSASTNVVKGRDIGTISRYPAGWR
uniref:Uncharacterized protein n=1 Tax=Leersia perrieri TaxID=77586 RepID=A0A0D9X6E0_9ORYZ